MSFHILISLCLLIFWAQIGPALSLAVTNKNDWTTRRQYVQAGISAGALTYKYLKPSPVLAEAGEQIQGGFPLLVEENDHSTAAKTAPSAGRFFFPALTPPFADRATYSYDLGRNAWAFEQLLSFANVTATIRCNVILLESGGLWIHSPQYPTGEFCKLLDDLGHPVEHIVLPCNALEHKSPMKALVKKYPKAHVWVSPGQYGPFGTCGLSISKSDKSNMGYRIDGILAEGNPLPPWAKEFDMATLYVNIPQNSGPVSEVAFCHKPSKTLIATDAVVYIPSGEAPPVFSTYFDEATVRDPSFWQCPCSKPYSCPSEIILVLKQSKIDSFAPQS